MHLLVHKKRNTRVHLRSNDTLLEIVLEIQIRMLWGLQDPNPDPLFRSMDLDPAQILP